MSDQEAEQPRSLKGEDQELLEQRVKRFADLVAGICARYKGYDGKDTGRRSWDIEDNG